MSECEALPIDNELLYDFNMDKLKIEHLKDHPSHLTTVANWIYNEWWTDKPGVTIESMKNRLEEAKTDDSIPLSMVALVDDRLAGTVNFIESDNSEFPDLKPWLAALLVAPNFRKKGIGSALVVECIQQAKKLGVKEFYLGTDIPEFYQALGAKIHTEGSKGLKIMKMVT